MNFVLASDDNFVPFLSITLVSLIENNKSDSEPLYIYILNDNISESNLKHLESLVRDDNVHLNFIKTKNLDEMDFSVVGLERNFNVSLTTYARLFIASLLPEDIDKIIYLDCDALVLGSFKELWDIDLGENYIGGVLDTVPDSLKEAFGFEAEENYFNAGVLLINLRKWREDNVEAEFLKFMEENQSRFYQHDQGIINNVFRDKSIVVDPKFNLMGHFSYLDYDLSKKFHTMKNSYYSEEIMKNAFNNPVFVHFNGGLKPSSNNYHPYRELFEKYAELSGYDKSKIFTTPKLTVKGRLFYKALNSPLFKVLLNLYPDSLLYWQSNRNILNGFKEENELASQMSKR